MDPQGLLPEMDRNAEAVLSPDGRYRYLLWRDLYMYPLRSESVVFIMLNPSTADADLDDPTIRRCKTFARRIGGKRLVVVNLYALRSTDPKVVLADFAAAVGPDNDIHIADAVSHCQQVVVAWGAMAQAGRVEEIRKMLALRGITPMCLGMNKDGSPKHPLYIKGDAPLVPWGSDSKL